MSASAAVRQQPAAAAAPVANDDFMTHMTAMTAHYTAKGAAAPKTAYALPLHLVAPVAATAASSAGNAGKAAVDAALNAGKTQTVSYATHQKTVVQGAMDKLQKDHDTDAFTQQMQAYEAQAQQQAHDTIHSQFQNLIKAGQAHPDQQQRILGLTNQIGAFFTNLLANVGAFLQKVAKQILDWIKSAVDWVKGAAATVANWVSGAVSSVGHFFSGLF